MDNLVDTLMNLFVFAFIGLLVWLYVKESPFDEKSGNDESHDGS